MNYVNPYAPVKTHVPAKSTVDVLLVVIGALMMATSAAVYTGMLLAIPVENHSFVYRTSPWLYGMLHFRHDEWLVVTMILIAIAITFTLGLGIASASIVRLVFK